MSPFLVQMFGEWRNSFNLVDSQLQLINLLENMVNCSLGNLENKRPLGEICDFKN